MVDQAFVNRYARADRLLHRMAFASAGLQVSLADIEDRLHRKVLAHVDISRPVLVTALPRAGTTVTLNLLYKTGEFASHTYRHMPFVLCPMLWQKISRSFRSADPAPMERAHGDGIALSVDSAEAFEEMVWQHFWPAHYQQDRVMPWGDDSHDDFDRFLRNHWRKLIALAGGDRADRYLSKNNMNVARLEYLAKHFPDAHIIVPFRDPLQHAASLLKQHRRFLATHREDRFAKTYMRGVGHYDFGANLLPIDFEHWLNGDERGNATELTFWLRYWVAAYRHILAQDNDHVALLPFEALTQHPQAALRWLADSVGVRQSKSLLAQSATLRTPNPHSVDECDLPVALIDEARDVWRQLIARSPAEEWRS